MKKKSVIAINLCLIASIVTLFGNKIYMLYIQYFGKFLPKN